MKKTIFIIGLTTLGTYLQTGILQNTFDTAGNLASDAVHAPGDILGHLHRHEHDSEYYNQEQRRRPGILSHRHSMRNYTQTE